MQHKIIKLTFLLCLLFACGDILAQTGKDSIPKNKNEKVWAVTDSAFHYKRIQLDSTHAKILKERATQAFHYKSMDSLRKSRPDSSRRKINFQRMKADSVHFKKMDSLHFVYSKKVRLDSMHFKLRDSLRFKCDTAQIFKKMNRQHFRSDSSRDKHLDSHYVYRKIIRLDSMRMKDKMERFDYQLKKIKKNLKERTDSVRMGVSKTISIQLTCNADATIRVDDLSKNIRIKTSQDNNVRLVAVIPQNGTKGESDESSFRALGVQLTGNADNVKIEKAARVEPADEKKSNIIMARNNAVTIYIPSKARLNVENSFADIVVEKDIDDINVTISYGNLSMANAGKAVIKSNDGNVSAAVIKDGDLRLSGSRLVCEAIEKLKINSKYSDVRFVRSDAFAFTSVSDKYDIKQATDVTGDKTFGEFKLSNLKNSFVLTGSSADVKINNIDLKAELIKIDNKYADIKLPVRQLENYSVAFGGDRTNVSAPFEKQFVTAESVANSNSNKNTNFTAAVGDVNSGHTQFQIKCSSCIVNFN